MNSSRRSWGVWTIGRLGIRHGDAILGVTTIGLLNTVYAFLLKGISLSFVSSGSLADVTKLCFGVFQPFAGRYDSLHQDTESDSYLHEPVWNTPHTEFRDICKVV